MMFDDSMHLMSVVREKPYIPAVSTPTKKTGVVYIQHF